MILRKFLYLSVASALAAGVAMPAGAQIFKSDREERANPAPPPVRRSVPQVRHSPPVVRTVPTPQPRPSHLTSSTPVPAPVAGIPAAFSAPAPVETTPASEAVMLPVNEPAPASPPAAVPAAVDAATPAPMPAVESQSAPVDAADAPEDAGAPLDLTAPPPAPTVAAITAPPGPPTREQTITKVNTYFNGIRTLVGNFTQVGPDGSKADGKFFLQKPGKVRFYYQRPSTTDIIADGKSLVVRDRKLATQDVYPLGQTPLKFLLDNNLDLARDSKVVGVHEEPGLVSVAIEEETTFGGKARVLIVFATQDQKNYELKQWTITDPQGLDTTVAVSELDTATKPDEKLFKVDYRREITRN